MMTETREASGGGFGGTGCSEEEDSVERFDGSVVVVGAP